MDDKMKDSYAKIEISQESRERIYKQILESGDCDGDMASGYDRGRKKRGGIALAGWKVGLAACLSLVLVIPAGVYAAGKLSEYFTVNIGKENYQAKINLRKSDAAVSASDSPEGKASKEKMKYIQVKADFGTDYKLEKSDISYVEDEKGNVTAVKDEIKEGSDGMYCYAHKDGFEAGKDFYYDVIYMDENEDSLLKLYDQALMKEITVNNHRALLCQDNTVQGSRYASDYDTDYTIDLYVFYEEYGYIIDFCCMQGLGQEKLIALAGKATVTETTRDKASRYEYLSHYQKAKTENPIQETAKKEVTYPVKAVKEKVERDGVVYQVTDVTVSSQVKDTDLHKFNSDWFTEESNYWDKNGKLKSYIREKIKVGDGVTQPMRSVVGTEKIQPKMVYVTMKVKIGKEDTLFELPDIDFFEREGEKYYDTGLYRLYKNRPEKIEDALIDFMPCYFKETDGGKGFWLKKMKAGEEQVYHFAYMVDGDMTDNMFLCFDNNMSEDTETQYVDISR